MFLSFSTDGLKSFYSFLTRAGGVLSWAVWSQAVCAGEHSFRDIQSSVIASIGWDSFWLVCAAILLLWAIFLARKQIQQLTRQKQALAHSEERLRVMVDSANLVVWESDAATGRFSYVSLPAQHLLGFPAENWMEAEFWEQHLHPDDRERVLKLVRGQTALMSAIECEYRLMHRDGHVVFVRDLRSPILGDDGRVQGMRGTFLDLSSLKESEAQLENSELRFRSAFEQAAVGMALCDVTGGFQRVNQRYCQICGYSEEALLQKDFRSITHRDDIENNERLLDQLVISGNTDMTLALEKRLLCSNGEEVWVLLTVSIVQSRKQVPDQFMEVIEDITARKQAVAELRESEGRMRSVLSTMRDGVIVRNALGEVVIANAAARRLYRLPCSDMVLPLYDPTNYRYLHEDGTEYSMEDLPSFQTMTQGISATAVVGIEHQDKSRVWFMSHAEPLPTDEQTGLHPVVVTLSDITEQRRAEEELRLAATVFDNSIEAIMITDAQRRILSVNAAFTHLTQFSSAEVIGMLPELLASNKHDKPYYESIWQEASQHGYWRGEVWQCRRDGTEFTEWLSLSAVRSLSGAITHFVAVFSDITERKANEARIAFLAHHDPLTELPNRALLQDRLTHALIRAERHKTMVALMFLDLDRFKTINDSLGHLAGDRLLKAVAERLKHCIRETDTVCRQGGDEFMVVLPDLVDQDAVLRVAEKILGVLSEPFVIDEHTLGTSFSIGIALYPADGRDSDVLMKNADTAMYHAKENGRNTYRFFAETMNANALEHLELENQLRQALDRHELLLNYQPQVDLNTGKVIGAEALIRWQSDALGFVPPSRFVSIAEESGLIVPIGRWVLRQACMHAKAWQDAGLQPTMVAVNISALQFSRDDIVVTVREALEATGLQPELLELELTESLLMHNVEAVQETMRRLKKLGVRLTIDDFGTGYSSLSYLKRFTVDRLKIDKSFVRDAADDPEDAAIVRAIIQLGRGLKLDVIAEGAEGEDQARFLIQEGCREAQGYYFCPPLTHADFMLVLKNGVNWKRPEPGRVLPFP